MFYVTRNPDGSVQSLSKEAGSGSESLAADHPDVQAFLGAAAASAAASSNFGESDAEFVRVLEDLIDTLILKNVIYHTDLPVAAQKKLLARKGLRSRLQGALTLLGNDDRLI